MTSKTIVEEVEAGDLLGSRTVNRFFKFMFFHRHVINVLKFRTLLAPAFTMARLALQARSVMSKLDSL